ncbi:ABC transporter substrate-binding protein [Enterovirga rhinocerotis]|uniref:Branched-chain amino acid transport system substrate-binding protein n=1 Tax=Enterovirga rhinocerotis TaxID=1339210 RepID=A0A4V3DXL4_9HYPH|nr:ABC transporter substrate-binding protein [Enterovirga rhinocerotis]TDR89199.1 branched-chain amino acid transport system substrate-binding protein [Enterovirga rhinocerotis]
MIFAAARRAFAVAAIAAATISLSSGAARPEIRVGVVYDLTGPLAASGSKAAYLGTRIAIDMINERGGVAGRRIVPLYADSRSRADAALAEAGRLIGTEKVDLLMGFFSSAHCDPVSAMAEAQKTFTWLTVCVASEVIRDRNLTYVFRPQVQSEHYGEASCDFVAAEAKARFGKEPKDMAVAIIHGEGPYGAGIAAANESRCKALGIRVVAREAYDAAATDLMPLVTKLQRARPDVILHTGYSRDVDLLLRQSRKAGASWGALIGHGAGHAQIDRLRRAYGSDVDYLFNVDPVAAQLLDPETLQPGIGELTAELVRRYEAATGSSEIPTQASSGFNHAWILFTDVAPRALRSHGAIGAEALRAAALETDIPTGGTIQGYGVKFHPPGTPLAGQNKRAMPVVMQYVGQETRVVAPNVIRTAEPVMPLPRGHTYSR